MTEKRQRRRTDDFVTSAADDGTLVPMISVGVDVDGNVVSTLTAYYDWKGIKFEVTLIFFVCGT